MKIGYYAHYHGTGHCRQADKLAAHLSAIGQSDCDVLTVFTSLPKDAYTFSYIDRENIVRLPDEEETISDLLPGRTAEPWQPQCLHYSPVGNHNIQKRSQMLLAEVQARQIEMMIIDLSVEVALLCRTASIPYLYVRLPGDRNDAPHLNAFAGAIGIVAAYPEVLESAKTPEWVRQKTLYLGFLVNPKPKLVLSKPQFIKQLITLASKQKSEYNLDEQPMIVMVIKGFGGHKNIDDKLPQLRQLLPDAYIISLGPIEPNAKPYVDLATQVDSVTPFLHHSDLLVMACGLNAIGEVCQFDTPLVVIPAERPHAEQVRMAEALTALGRAITLEDLSNLLTTIQDNTNTSASLSKFKPSEDLVNSVSTTNSAEFTESIAKAKNVKDWFYNWLLPKIELQPERLHKP